MRPGMTRARRAREGRRGAKAAQCPLPEGGEGAAVAARKAAMKLGAVALLVAGRRARGNQLIVPLAALRVYNAGAPPCREGRRCRMYRPRHIIDEGTACSRHLFGACGTSTTSAYHQSSAVIENAAASPGNVHAASWRAFRHNAHRSMLGALIKSACVATEATMLR